MVQSSMLRRACCSSVIFLLALLPPFCHGLANSASKKNKRVSSGTGFGGASSSSWKVHRTDESASTQSLLQFLKSQNADIANVEIGFDPVTQRRGLYALKNFQKDKVICKIPSDCALACSDPAKQGEDAPTIAHAGANFLKLYMHPESARKLWSPYLDTLPSSEDDQIDTTPDFFPNDEIELLEFPRLVQQARQRKQDIEKVASEQGIDIKELQHATWIVSSRSYAIPVATGDNPNSETDVLRDERGQVMSDTKDRTWIRVLVPLLDMVNHCSSSQQQQLPNAKLTLLDPEKDNAWFALTALRPIPQGKEITISYGGVASSIELLLNYGFVQEGNKIDALVLQKGGDDVLASLSDWTTTLDEDETMLSMLSDNNNDEEDANLKKILSFRIQMKRAYSEVEDDSSP